MMVSGIDGWRNPWMVPLIDSIRPRIGYRRTKHKKYKVKRRAGYTPPRKVPTKKHKNLW